VYPKTGVKHHEWTRINTNVLVGAKSSSPAEGAAKTAVSAAGP